MQVTMVAVKGRMVVTKVKRAIASSIDLGKVREAGPSTTQKSTPVPSEIHLPRMERCLRLLEDSILLEVKKEA